ncbi:MAG: hypothetical protein ABI881_09065 [Betaproteobacteria bacterium]
MPEHSRHVDGLAAVVLAPLAAPVRPPLVIAQVIVRNAVPVVGILVFGWQAFNVLALYFIDTLLMIGTLCAGLARAFLPVDKDSLAGRANTEFGFIGAGIMIAGMMAIPLGVPLLFMVNGDIATIKATFTDRGFYIGVAIQAAMALWMYLGLRRAIDAGSTPGSLRLKRRFALIFLRWIVVLMVVYTGIGLVFGRFAALLFVVVYVIATVVAELAPDRFLRALPGGAEDAGAQAKAPMESTRGNTR